jgi:hypothetical protein
MPREVNVKLSLDITDYLGDERVAEAVTERLDDKVEELGRDAERAADKIAELGRDSVKTAGEMGLLAGAIEATKMKLDGMLHQLDHNPGEDGLLGNIRKTRQELRELEKAQSDLNKSDSGGEGIIGAGARLGNNFGGGFIQGTFRSIAAGGPVVIGAAVILAGAAVIALGAALAAGFTVIGIGGIIAGGIAGAIQDPMVARSFSALGEQLKSQFREATQSFSEPLQIAAVHLSNAFNPFMENLRSNFESLAPLIGKLETGVEGFLGNLSPGIDALVDVGGPFIEELAAELPNLGNAITDFFRSLQSAGPGALQFFADLLGFVKFSIVAFGNVIEVLSKIYFWMNALARASHGDFAAQVDIYNALGSSGESAFFKLKKSSDEASDSIKHLAAGGAEATAEYGRLMGVLNTTAETASTVEGAMVSKVVNSLLATDNAALGVETALTRVSEAFKQQSNAAGVAANSIDIHTAKGQINRAAVLQSVAANIRQYQTMIDSGIKAEDAAAAYDVNTQSLERQLREAGLNSEQIQVMIGKYKNVPAIVRTEIAIHGLTDAINNLERTIRLIAGIHSTSATITVTTVQRTVNMVSSSGGGAQGGAFRYGGIYEHAEEGLLHAGVYGTRDPARYAFAEPGTGGEAFIPKFGDYHRSISILDRAEAWYGRRAAPMGNAGGGGGGNVSGVVEVILSGGDAATDAMLSGLRKAIRMRGGNVQFVLSEDH